MNLISAANMTKVYPGTIALNNVSVSFESGKINALIGKNGSGKSTLVKIFSGAIKPTQGKILYNNSELSFNDPSEAFKNGIATVYQELSLNPYLSVAENMFMGRLAKKGLFIDWTETYKLAQELLNSMEVDISPKDIILDLPIWKCQIVEILKAMSYDPVVLLLDEPTSSLAVSEVKKLFEFIRKLVTKDVIIIFITHRLEELWQIADTCTVLRDGECIGKVNMESSTHNDIINMMFGDVKTKKRIKEAKLTNEVMLEVNGLTREKVFQNISFKLYKGEILGLAGMLGAGRTEILRAIFGLDKFQTGEIFFNGKLVHSPSPQKMKSLGFAIAPEDRKNQGLNLIMSVKENLTLAALDKFTNHTFINNSEEKKLAEKQVSGLDIKISGLDLPVSSLSGGNQQKVVVGNWLNSNPKIMFFDEPSRGIDVNAKQQIFQIIWEQSKKGISSIMVSSELEELLEVCHRIIVLRNGIIMGKYNADELTLDELYLLCMGGTK